MSTRLSHETAKLGAATPAAQNTAISGYPKKLASACAEVLARLLVGEVLTAEDTLVCSSTMRAAAHAHYLANAYGWPIVSEPRVVACADGRLVTVAAYHLPQSAIAQAAAAGAAGWCKKVREARAALRIKAIAARRCATTLNKSRRVKKFFHPGQSDLFE